MDVGVLYKMFKNALILTFVHSVRYLKADVVLHTSDSYLYWSIKPLYSESYSIYSFHWKTHVSQSTRPDPTC